MKALMITYNQSLNEMIMDILDNNSVRGFTKWEDVQGRGTKKGEPHYGSHAWPSKNICIIAVVEPEKATVVIEKLNSLNNNAEKQGLTVYVWDVYQGV